VPNPGGAYLEKEFSKNRNGGWVVFECSFKLRRVKRWVQQSESQHRQIHDLAGWLADPNPACADCLGLGLKVMTAVICNRGN
jgi:hypothetical protein